MVLLSRFKIIWASLFLAVVFFSCSEVNFVLPHGPKGEDGLSTYEIWKKEVEAGHVNWPKDKVDISDFLVYIKGEKGDKGADGKSAYELWKEMITVGNVPNPHVPGELWDKDRNTESDFWDYLRGRDGVSPHIGDNGNWWVGDQDTGVPAKGKDGKDGITPHIGKNENWWIGITDTGVPARGQNGQDGLTPHVGTNGNWWIGDQDTGIPARGQDGEDGKDGLSAYESWYKLAITGSLDDPKTPGQKWPADKVEVEHFIQYLTGANGKDGISGKDGVDGKDGVTPYIGSNGNWFIGAIDTGVPAKGQDGQDGIDGKTPNIGSNGNWFIGTVDTGVPAKGSDGKEGVSPHIGNNGNWFIGKVDTGVPARGNDGSSGADGKTAYELWVEDVKKGLITDPNSGALWPATDITQADFWRYLKGRDGQDGVDGKSAYMIWKEMAETGALDDPKNPTIKWPKDKTSETDFWLYLMGKDGKDGVKGEDGKSAYELWVEEVAKGLKNPHDENGGEWPKDKTSVGNFWEYLSGKDGIDGKPGADGKPGEPGTPGGVVEIVRGVPNVIVQYSLQEQSEYVRWSDGSVVYIVYDDTGVPSAGAKVKGMPGIDPNLEYTSDDKGQFIVQKEDLPEGEAIENLVGKTTAVTYKKSNGSLVTETSAPNTYVPNRIRTRLIRARAHQKLTLLDGEISLPFRLQRNIGTPNAVWENIPNSFDTSSMPYAVYELNDKDDPTSLNYGKAHASVYKRPSEEIYINIPRPEIKPSYLKKVTREWDGEDHYYGVKMSSKGLYGEQPTLPVVVKTAPIQYMPMISDIYNVKTYGSAFNAVAELSVKFNVDEINAEYFYKYVEVTRTVTANNGMDYEYHEPIQAELGTYDAKDVLHVNFRYILSTGDLSVNNSKNKASLNNPSSTLNNVVVESSVSVSCYFFLGLNDPNSPYFIKSLSGDNSNIGKLRYDSTTNTLSFISNKTGDLNIPDILDIPIQ